MTAPSMFPDLWALIPTLEVAVPLRIAELARQNDEQRGRTMRAWAANAADVIASRGDQLMFRSKPHKGEGGTADTFNDLARALAVGAFVPGGVTFAGMHWEWTPRAESPAPEVPRQRTVETADLAGDLL